MIIVVINFKQDVLFDFFYGTFFIEEDFSEKYF